ncbi:MAG: hypothetical protein FJ161_00195 [Gammaproteobacteria bacterium]|nr:hypothetical protein [Gammaproteobacteria bacterium]
MLRSYSHFMRWIHTQQAKEEFIDYLKLQEFFSIHPILLKFISTHPPKGFLKYYKRVREAYLATQPVHVEGDVHMVNNDPIASASRKHTQEKIVQYLKTQKLSPADLKKGFIEHQKNITQCFHRIKKKLFEHLGSVVPEKNFDDFSEDFQDYLEYLFGQYRNGCTGYTVVIGFYLQALACRDFKERDSMLLTFFTGLNDGRLGYLYDSDKYIKSNDQFSKGRARNWSCIPGCDERLTDLIHTYYTSKESVKSARALSQEESLSLPDRYYTHSVSWAVTPKKQISTMLLDVMFYAMMNNRYSWSIADKAYWVIHAKAQDIDIAAENRAKNTIEAILLQISHETGLTLSLMDIYQINHPFLFRPSAYVLSIEQKRVIRKNSTALFGSVMLEIEHMIQNYAYHPFKKPCSEAQYAAIQEALSGLNHHEIKNILCIPYEEREEILISRTLSMEIYTALESVLPEERAIFLESDREYETYCDWVEQLLNTMIFENQKSDLINILSQQFATHSQAQEACQRYIPSFKLDDINAYITEKSDRELVIYDNEMSEFISTDRIEYDEKNLDRWIYSETPIQASWLELLKDIFKSHDQELYSFSYEMIINHYIPSRTLSELVSELSEHASNLITIAMEILSQNPASEQWLYVTSPELISVILDRMRLEIDIIFSKDRDINQETGTVLSAICYPTEHLSKELALMFENAINRIEHDCSSEKVAHRSIILVNLARCFSLIASYFTIPQCQNLVAKLLSESDGSSRYFTLIGLSVQSEMAAMALRYYSENFYRYFESDFVRSLTCMINKDRHKQVKALIAGYLTSLGNQAQLQILCQSSFKVCMAYSENELLPLYQSPIKSLLSKDLNQKPNEYSVMIFLQNNLVTEEQVTQILISAIRKRNFRIITEILKNHAFLISQDLLDNIILEKINSFPEQYIDMFLGRIIKEILKDPITHIKLLSIRSNVVLYNIFRGLLKHSEFCSTFTSKEQVFELLGDYFLDIPLLNRSNACISKIFSHEDIRIHLFPCSKELITYMQTQEVDSIAQKYPNVTIYMAIAMIKEGIVENVFSFLKAINTVTYMHQYHPDTPLLRNELEKMISQKQASANLGYKAFAESVMFLAHQYDEDFLDNSMIKALEYVSSEIQQSPFFMAEFYETLWEHSFQSNAACLTALQSIFKKSIQPIIFEKLKSFFSSSTDLELCTHLCYTNSILLSTPQITALVKILLDRHDEKIVFQRLLCNDSPEFYTRVQIVAALIRQQDVPITFIQTHCSTVVRVICEYIEANLIDSAVLLFQRIIFKNQALYVMTLDEICLCEPNAVYNFITRLTHSGFNKIEVLIQSIFFRALMNDNRPMLTMIYSKFNSQKKPDLKKIIIEDLDNSTFLRSLNKPLLALNVVSGYGDHITTRTYINLLDRIIDIFEENELIEIIEAMFTQSKLEYFFLLAQECELNHIFTILCQYLLAKHQEKAFREYYKGYISLFSLNKTLDNEVMEYIFESTKNMRQVCFAQGESTSLLEGLAEYCLLTPPLSKIKTIIGFFATEHSSLPAIIHHKCLNFFTQFDSQFLSNGIPNSSTMSSEKIISRKIALLYGIDYYLPSDFHYDLGAFTSKRTNLNPEDVRRTLPWVVRQKNDIFIRILRDLIKNISDHTSVLLQISSDLTPILLEKILEEVTPIICNKRGIFEPDNALILQDIIQKSIAQRNPAVLELLSKCYKGQYKDTIQEMIFKHVEEIMSNEKVKRAPEPEEYGALLKFIYNLLSQEAWLSLCTILLNAYQYKDFVIAASELDKPQQKLLTTLIFKEKCNSIQEYYDIITETRKTNIYFYRILLGETADLAAETFIHERNLSESTLTAALSYGFKLANLSAILDFIKKIQPNLKHIENMILHAARTFIAEQHIQPPAISQSAKLFEHPSLTTYICAIVQFQNIESVKELTLYIARFLEKNAIIGAIIHPYTLDRLSIKQYIASLLYSTWNAYISDLIIYLNYQDTHLILYRDALEIGRTLKKDLSLMSEQTAIEHCPFLIYLIKMQAHTFIISGIKDTISDLLVCYYNSPETFDILCDRILDLKEANLLASFIKSTYTHWGLVMQLPTFSTPTWQNRVLDHSMAQAFNMCIHLALENLTDRSVIEFFIKCYGEDFIICLFDQILSDVWELNTSLKTVVLKRTQFSETPLTYLTLLLNTVIIFEEHRNISREVICASWHKEGVSLPAFVQEGSILGCERAVEYCANEYCTNVEKYLELFQYLSDRLDRCALLFFVEHSQEKRKNLLREDNPLEQVRLFTAYIDENKLFKYRTVLEHLSQFLLPKQMDAATPPRALLLSTPAMTEKESQSSPKAKL